ncbi:MAG: hypothetical protein PWQ79_671 [Thermococcaceae archaeon]|nr:hypothetical protein [Thermococcaceae archaeon]MDK2913756.1 hypothetical protein [Thermococcaceae archaeon]
MKLVNIQHDSVSIEDCVANVVMKSQRVLSNTEGYIVSSKISLTFGAFMNLSVTLAIDSEKDMKKGIIADYSHGRSRGEALSRAIESLNSKLPARAQIVDFETGTYTTPVTRRIYAVAVAVYNYPLEEKRLDGMGPAERRSLLRKVLREFNYNPKVLNISELARVFGVSRDSIYYDIEQILKERKVRKG